MANSTADAIPAEGLAVTGNLTLMDSFSRLPATLWEQRDLLALQARIVVAALGCIYVGSFASLRRPPSASPPKKKKNGKYGEKDEDDDDQFVQGLVASDAIMFPILAGTVLVGLYYLIKWLEDPAIISKIMGVYFSVMSLASMGKLLADFLHFVTGLVFPEVWKCSDGILWRFDGAKKCQYRLDDGGERVYDNAKMSPFPGTLFSKWRFSESKHNLFWELRHLYQEQWTVRFAMHGLGKHRIQLRLNDVLGAFMAIGASILYQTTKSNMLSNIMGYAFSYVGIVTLSPTSFAIGSSVLFGLFFYDIYMVFYTPYMVTVATKLDVPIKLVFESGKRSSMLGLGDIVVPGMFIGLCLRFDHFLHYYRQRQLVPVELRSEEKGVDGVVAEVQETQRMVQKPKYVNPMGQWGNRFWGSGSATPAVQAAAFKKTYFKAALVGYFLAMLATLTMLLVFKHAQPALLYLVPGVVSAVWITGAVRGELHEMWIYTEDGTLDKEDVIVEVDGSGNVLKVVEDKKEEDESKEDSKTSDAKADTEASGAVDLAQKEKPHTSETKKSKKASSRTVFAFTIEAPPSPTEVVDQ
ncbi:hypothetical protein JX265_012520 [Neoarthrinium moseri]|uniref:Signal peptide peptidase n=1 Tax=Neoarthrinium moseri TaxID=1658444 RepID=A0A9Q0AIK6_9PEZI|nr:hypothetical protein JX265_012520 [Neoarthrinium moseri]